MIASDVMTTGVITVGLNTRVDDIVMTLLSNRISAVPVLDEHGALIGIASEADLIHRVEIRTEQRRSWWRDLLRGKRARARSFLKSHGFKSTDIMTKPVIAANPETPLGELVTLFDKHRIKRVPVVDHGKIVGIVSRANILQALALSRKELAHDANAEAV
jgi:CBS-domain-containing membrane protein